MSSFSLRLLFQGLPTCNKMHRCLWMCFMSLYFHHFWLWVFSLPAASGSLFPWLSSGCLSVHGKLFALGMLCFRIGKLLHFVHEDWLVSKHSYQHRLPPCCTVSALKKTEYRTKQTMNKLTKCHPWQILKTQSTWCTWVKKKESVMSCITWQTETYLILKQYQSGEILHAFLPALNDCTEKKKNKTTPLQKEK